MLVFFDDILIYSKNFDDHLTDLDMVLTSLEDNQLYINQKKCTFARRQLEYLRYIVSRKGVSADSTKVQVMLDWPTRRSIEELWGFLHLTGYYRCFVAGYGHLALSLMQQLKDNFIWTEMAETAF